MAEKISAPCMLPAIVSGLPICASAITFMVPCGLEHVIDVLLGTEEWGRWWRGVMVTVGGGYL